jgi:hypothetical protein
LIILLIHIVTNLFTVSIHDHVTMLLLVSRPVHDEHLRIRMYHRSLPDSILTAIIQITYGDPIVFVYQFTTSTNLLVITILFISVRIHLIRIREVIMMFLVTNLSTAIIRVRVTIMLVFANQVTVCINFKSDYLVLLADIYVRMAILFFDTNVLIVSIHVLVRTVISISHRTNVCK